MHSHSLMLKPIYDTVLYDLGPIMPADQNHNKLTNQCFKQGERTRVAEADWLIIACPLSACPARERWGTSKNVLDGCW